jgi:hypothetical protein
VTSPSARQIAASDALLRACQRYAAAHLLSDRVLRAEPEGPEPELAERALPWVFFEWDQAFTRLREALRAFDEAQAPDPSD